MIFLQCKRLPVHHILYGTVEGRVNVEDYLSTLRWVSVQIPKDLLTANVSPIYNGGQRVDTKNFRLVSHTST